MDDDLRLVLAEAKRVTGYLGLTCRGIRSVGKEVPVDHRLLVVYLPTLKVWATWKGEKDHEPIS